MANPFVSSCKALSKIACIPFLGNTAMGFNHKVTNSRLPFLTRYASAFKAYSTLYQRPKELVELDNQLVELGVIQKELHDRQMLCNQKGITYYEEEKEKKFEALSRIACNMDDKVNPSMGFNHEVTNSHLDLCTRALFDSWCKLHGKRYSSDEEKDYRFNIFKECCKRINEHNASGYTYKMGLNLFSDQTLDELMAKYGGGGPSWRRFDLPPVDGEGRVIEVHSVDEWKDHFRKGVESKKLVVIEFIPALSEPYRSYFGPMLAGIAKERAHVIFLRVGVDEHKTVAEEFKLEGLPTYLILKEGNELYRRAGSLWCDMPDEIDKHAGVTTAP